MGFPLTANDGHRKSILYYSFFRGRVLRSNNLAVVQLRSVSGLQSGVFAVQQVAHRLPASFVCFFGGLTLVGVHAALTCSASRFGSAAVQASVGEAWFIRLQLELFAAHRANFDGKSHLIFYDTTVRTVQKSTRAIPSLDTSQRRVLTSSHSKEFHNRDRATSLRSACRHLPGRSRRPRRGVAGSYPLVANIHSRRS